MFEDKGGGFPSLGGGKLIKKPRLPYEGGGLLSMVYIILIFVYMNILLFKISTKASKYLETTFPIIYIGGKSRPL